MESDLVIKPKAEKLNSKISRFTLVSYTSANVESADGYYLFISADQEIDLRDSDFVRIHHFDLILQVKVSGMIPRGYAAIDDFYFLDKNEEEYKKIQYGLINIE